MDIFVLLLLISLFSSLLAYNVFVWFFMLLQAYFEGVLCMQYFESVYVHATNLLFPFSSDCATNWKSYLVLAPKFKCLGSSIANYFEFLKPDKRE